MIRFENEHFYGLFDRGEKLLLADRRFEDCTFSHGGFSMTKDVARMSEARNIELIDCTEDGCDVGPSILRNVSVKNLKTSDLFILWTPFFDRVTLAGEIGKVKINPWAHFSDRTDATQRPFDEFRATFYADVEWALDLSAARFKEFDMRGVPGRLIRRDPESQVLVTRERALQVAKPGWEKQLDPANKLWPFMINLFLSDGEADTVLVAPLGAAKAKRDPLLKGLKELRDIGLAEAD